MHFWGTNIIFTNYNFTNTFSKKIRVLVPSHFSYSDPHKDGKFINNPSINRFQELGRQVVKTMQQNKETYFTVILQICIKRKGKQGVSITEFGFRHFLRGGGIKFVGWRIEINTIPEDVIVTFLLIFLHAMVKHIKRKYHYWSGILAYYNLTSFYFTSMKTNNTGFEGWDGRRSSSKW